jgi:hypothetical protein
MPNDVPPAKRRASVIYTSLIVAVSTQRLKRLRKRPGVSTLDRDDNQSRIIKRLDSSRPLLCGPR